MEWLLPLLILVPFAGAGMCAMASAQNAKRVALGVSLLTAIIAIVLTTQFDFHQDLSASMPEKRLSESVQIDFKPESGSPFQLEEIGFSPHLGVDTISIWLVLLTVLLTPLAIAASFDSIRERTKEYYAWMLVLLAAMLGVFIARDLLLFYIFFELTLVPMFFIIGIWGGPERRVAAGKFFLFTFTGSVFTLAGVIYLGMQRGSFDISELTMFAQTSLTRTERFWVLMSFIAGFAVKVPLFPVHTWLPLAHTEAPTAGSVILAGVLLKLGTYGLLRLAVPMGMVGVGGVVFPTTLKVIAVLCIIGIIYGALVAWVQRDIKKLVAYSSVSHLGFCILGLCALNAIGIQGSILYMINHGLSTGALFLVIGMIYDRYHTRDINQLSGLAKIMPKLAFFFVFFTLASIGLPGLNGFVSEFLTVLGAFTSPHLGIAYGSFAALGVILGAVYMLHMLARVLFGPLKVPEVDQGTHDEGQAASPEHERIDYAQPGTKVKRIDHGPQPLSNDINGRELAILVPLAAFCLVLGLASPFLTRSMQTPVQLLHTVATMQPAVAPKPQVRSENPNVPNEVAEATQTP
ncbi:MAG: NADH-quinone oxidoreductase subunit M [Anaerolineae bacterium]|nr:NADH-quinone oxidoreductase subunit M [Phycisphaerae bacterium]